MATNSAVSSRVDDPQRQAVAQLFVVFQRLFPNRWEKQFSDPLARGAWLVALRHAGVTAAQIHQGMAKASALGWPPSAGEFVALCRPPVPDLARAIAEAQTWARETTVRWSHPAIGAAALMIGSYRIRRMTAEQLEQRMGRALVDAHARYLAGEDLTVPPELSLPKPERHGLPPGHTSAVADAERAKLARLLGVSL